VIGNSGIIFPSYLFILQEKLFALVIHISSTSTLSSKHMVNPSWYLDIHVLTRKQRTRVSNSPVLQVAKAPAAAEKKQEPQNHSMQHIPNEF
jgi:hypothetical protein